MKKLLLLDNRHTPDTSDMWRTAIRLGWATQRTNQLQVKSHIEGYDYIRYYGNTLHWAQIKDQLPIKDQSLNLSLHLPELFPYTKRKIETMTFGELKQPVEKDCFIKPAHEKWFEARVYRKGHTVWGEPRPEDPIYISEIVSFVDEVRCFVLNGEILTASYYRINSIPWDQTKEHAENVNFDHKLKDSPLPQMAREIVKLIPNCPKGVVLDFGLLPNGEWAFVEPNECWASGLYYTDYSKALEVVCAAMDDTK
jgi:hypothetical protein